VLKLWFNMAGHVAPGVAERQAATLFLTPRRRRPARLPDDWTQMTVHGLAAWTVGHGPTVLLAHGWEGSAADFVPMASALARNAYRAVLLDMPAHGRSAGRSTTVVEWLRALSAMADTLGGVDAVVGHSLGAMAVALALSESHVDARAAVLVAPVASPEQFLAPFARMIGLPARRTANMMQRVTQRVGRSVESLDLRLATRDLAVPSLILHDPHDRVAAWSYARAIADAWPGSRLSACDGLGHRRLLGDAYTIARAVEFLDRRLAAPVQQLAPPSGVHQVLKTRTAVPALQ
jgi:pimeloyl-ACP methyl ester carboxylesterase